MKKDRQGTLVHAVIDVSRLPGPREPLHHQEEDGDDV
jgi:hypothetical protein